MHEGYFGNSAKLKQNKMQGAGIPECLSLLTACHGRITIRLCIKKCQKCLGRNKLHSIFVEPRV